MRRRRICRGASDLVVLLVIAVAAQQGATRAGGLRSFEIVPLEKVSETSSNASIGDVNEDGEPDIVLAKGRHWQVTTLTFFGDGKGHFTPGPPLPSKAVKSYSGSLADMTRSGHLDIVLSNDAPDPKLVLLRGASAPTRRHGTGAPERLWAIQSARTLRVRHWLVRQQDDVRPF